MKTCRTCKEPKPDSEFPSNGWQQRVDGSKFQVRKADCKPCHNKSANQSFNQRMDSLGLVWKCQRCGYDRCRDALDFHHLDGNTKEFVIAARQSISLERLTEEINKCILLCSNCHRELHAGLWSLGD